MRSRAVSPIFSFARVSRGEIDKPICCDTLPPGRLMHIRLDIPLNIRLILTAALFAMIGFTAEARGQDLAKGTLLADVKCLADATESYALYLPSSYSPDRQWSLLMAFHPAARGPANSGAARANARSCANSSPAEHWRACPNPGTRPAGSSTGITSDCCVRPIGNTIRPAATGTFPCNPCSP